MRGRSSQSRDSPLMGSLHEMEIDILGITGITVDRSKLGSGSGGGGFYKKSSNTGLAAPEKMKAVVAAFSDGQFCASSGLSHQLRKTPSEPNNKNNKKNGRNAESLIALWSKRSRTSKIKFVLQLDDSISPEEPAIFEIWVALTDGKGENKTCVSFPIGLGTLPIDGEQNKPFLLDLPMKGLTSMHGKDGEPLSVSPPSSSEEFDSFVGEEKKTDQNNHNDVLAAPTVASVYGLKNHGGSILRLKVQCKRYKNPKKDRRRNRKVSNLQECASHYSDDEGNDNNDDEDSKLFRPIETSSLVSDSAYSLGDVVSSRLPTITLTNKDRKASDFGIHLNELGGTIDESQEMDFSDIGSLSVDDRNGKTFENGPKSAFTAISPSKTAPLTCSSTTVGKCESSGKLNQPVGAGSPTDLGTLNPMQDEPSELGDSWRIYRKQVPPVPEMVNADDELELPELQPGLSGDSELIRRRKQKELSTQQGQDQQEQETQQQEQQQDQVPMIIRTVSQIKGKGGSAKRALRHDRPKTSGDGSLVRSIVSTAVKKDDTTTSCIPYCGIFGPMLRIPITLLTNDAEEELVLRDFDDDHTWSTIETRNSSQIVAWHDSVRSYAAETSSLVGENRAFGSAFDPQCVRDIQHYISTNTQGRPSSSSKKKGEEGGGWWNDGVSI